LFFCLVLYIIGGLISLTQTKSYEEGPIFLAVSAFLVLTSFFYSSLIADDPRRLKIITNAYIAAGCATSILGILGYFSVVPGAYDLFTRWGRATGGFEDSNVFGPFLIAPMGFLFYGILVGEKGSTIFRMGAMLIMAFGIFIAFSRAAWALTILTMLGIFITVFINTRGSAGRMRLFVLLGFAAAAMVVMLIAVLSMDAVSSLFSERAHLVQNYDGGRDGRFYRHIEGFKFILNHPLGLGPLEFGRIYFTGGDPHNIYLKSFAAYGWLGGIIYPIFVIWTIIKAAPLLFLARPWQPVLIVCFVTFVGHQLVGIVIDVDHWRHYFLLIGMLWGMIAAEAKWKNNQYGAEL
ncbi:MAG: O-antigen ligase family protein, partial [Rhizobiales bacterium]|nr:O-antigen ligase family protein [Hyphomicrobiales bacterium]